MQIHIYKSNHHNLTGQTWQVKQGKEGLDISWQFCLHEAAISNISNLSSIPTNIFPLRGMTWPKQALVYAWDHQSVPWTTNTSNSGTGDLGSRLWLWKAENLKWVYIPDKTQLHIHLIAAHISAILFLHAFSLQKGAGHKSRYPLRRFVAWMIRS